MRVPSLRLGGRSQIPITPSTATSHSIMVTTPWNLPTATIQMRRSGTTNAMMLLGLGSVVIVMVLSVVLFMGQRFRDPSTGKATHLLVYCAAGIRYPMEEIAHQYEREYGVRIELQYGGSNTLLSQVEVSRHGDLYLAADDSYIEIARSKDLAAESLSLGTMRPVIAVPRGNPKSIQGIDDLLRPDVRVALANPDAAAVGKKTRKLLKATGEWAALAGRVTESGVFKPTVNEVANDVKLGSVDAGIVWDSTVAQYQDLDAIRVATLEAGAGSIQIAVLQSARDPTSALHFARYAAARDRGLTIFLEKGFDVVDGDRWADVPKLTFFAGAVNRRALEPIVREFQEREGVQINLVYNGCGILTAQMRSIQQSQESGFPDTYMACDTYYLETVQTWFEQGVNVSQTDIVIVTQKGNPANIQTLSDLARPGLRVVIGQPDQCTIGVLTRRLLESEALTESVMKNVVSETATSALLIPAITAKSADAVLAYRTDTQAESEKLHVVNIDSRIAKAVQPYSISLSSDYKHLSQRLFEAIARSREQFERAGFQWRLSEPPAPSSATSKGDGRP